MGKRRSYHMIDVSFQTLLWGLSTTKWRRAPNWKVVIMDKTTNAADNPKDPTQLPIGDNLCAALTLLRYAYECARDTHAAPWDFALEISELYDVGLTITDLRWLVAKGFVEHGSETSTYSEPHRSFTRSEGFNFLTTTCVILTEKGAEFACQVLQAAAAINAVEEPRAGLRKSEPNGEIPPANGETHFKASHKPHWDPVRRKLSLAGRIVKQFHVPAGNQEVILSAFQEEGWPQYIDDPLPGNRGINPKTRLNDAIYRLNRKQLTCLIRFHTNGTGSGVHWSLLLPKTMRQLPSTATEPIAELEA